MRYDSSLSGFASGLRVSPRMGSHRAHSLVPARPLPGTPTGTLEGPASPELGSPKNHCPLHSPFCSETSPRTQRVEFH